MKELREKKMPLIIRRHTSPIHYEDWDVNELIVLDIWVFVINCHFMWLSPGGSATQVSGWLIDWEINSKRCLNASKTYSFILPLPGLFTNSQSPAPRRLASQATDPIPRPYKSFLYVLVRSRNRSIDWKSLEWLPMVLRLPTWVW